MPDLMLYLLLGDAITSNFRNGTLEGNTQNLCSHRYVATVQFLSCIAIAQTKY